MIIQTSVSLTDGMTKLLNRGLNFAILPLKLDITQVLVDYKHFERSAIWQEFWFGKEKFEYKPSLFNKKKRNLPKNYTVPTAVKTFLSAAKSEMLDPRNRDNNTMQYTTREGRGTERPNKTSEGESYCDKSL